MQNTQNPSNKKYSPYQEKWKCHIQAWYQSVNMVCIRNLCFDTNSSHFKGIFITSGRKRNIRKYCVFWSKMTACIAKNHEESNPSLTTDFWKNHYSLQHPAYENISRSHVQACTNKHCTQLISWLINGGKRKTP